MSNIVRGKSCNIEGARKAHSEDYVYTIIEAGARRALWDKDNKLDVGIRDLPTRRMW